MLEAPQPPVLFLGFSFPLHVALVLLVHELPERSLQATSSVTICGSVLVLFLFTSELFITVDITFGSSFCHLASVGLDVARLHFCWSLAPKTAATKCEDV